MAAYFVSLFSLSFYECNSCLLLSLRTRKRKFGESFSRIMARRGVLSQQQILSALNDIPEDVSEYEDDDDLDSDDYLPNESESSSSDSDVEEKEIHFSGKTVFNLWFL